RHCAAEKWYEWCQTGFGEKHRAFGLEADGARRRVARRMIYEVTIGEQSFRVEVERAGPGWKCSLNGRELPVDVVSGEDGVLSLLLAGKSYEVKQENTATETKVVVGHERFSVAVRDPRSFRSRRRAGAEAQGVKKITAPMPGKVVRLLVAEGSAVEAG